MFRVPVFGSLIQHLGQFADHREAVPEPFRDPQLAPVLSRERCACPLAEIRRGATQVDGDVEYFPSDRTNQLALREPQLVVQSSQYALDGGAVVVLHELSLQASRLLEVHRVEALEEEPAF